MPDEDGDQPRDREKPERPPLYAQGEPGNFSGLPGEISEVTGRKAQGGRRGLPALDRFNLRLEQDGRELEFGPLDDGPEQRAEFVAEIFAHSFGRNDREQATWTPMCPICLSDGPMTDEHVPQGPLGGFEMTMTCKRCNNVLGSVIESELEHWYDDALVGVTFAHEDVPGARKLPRLFALMGPDGFALIPEGGALPPAVDPMLRSGSFSMTYRPPDSRRYRLALLKHAYLAACLYLGYVPGIPEADEIRHDLIAARGHTEARPAARQPDGRTAQVLPLGLWTPGPTLGHRCRPEAGRGTRAPDLAGGDALSLLAVLDRSPTQHLPDSPNVPPGV